MMSLTTEEGENHTGRSLKGLQGSSLARGPWKTTARIRNPGVESIRTPLLPQVLGVFSTGHGGTTVRAGLAVQRCRTNELSDLPFVGAGANEGGGHETAGFRGGATAPINEPSLMDVSKTDPNAGCGKGCLAGSSRLPGSVGLPWSHRFLAALTTQSRPSPIPTTEAPPARPEIIRAGLIRLKEHDVPYSGAVLAAAITYRWSGGISVMPSFSNQPCCRRQTEAGESPAWQAVVFVFAVPEPKLYGPDAKSFCTARYYWVTSQAADPW